VTATTTTSGAATAAENQVATASNVTVAPNLPTLAKPVDKVVYYDANNTTNWITDANAQQIRDYFVGKGYKEVDAAGLATFMKAHATSKAASVVVMGNDIYPDTVVDLTHMPVDNKNIINDYMNAGGRVVQAGDWPFYNISQATGGNDNLAGGGGPAILGFNVASGTQTLTATTPTAIGAAMGLKSTWMSQRPTDPSFVDVNLEGTMYGAAGWIKFFPTSAGPGAFMRVVDTVPDNNTLTDDELADMQLLAEFSGPFPTVGGGTMGGSGDINADGKVNVQDATLSLAFAVGTKTATDAQKTAGDINGDGKLDIKDATLILKKAVGG